MILKDAHAKTQRRKEIQVSKAQAFFAPLRLCVSICLLSFAVGAMAQTTNDLSDAETQGRNLAQIILEQKPATNSTLNGILKIQSAKNLTTNIPVSLQIAVSAERWISVYDVPRIVSVAIGHPKSQANFYVYCDETKPNFGSSWGTRTLNENEIIIPFAGSDFWLCDLGLEFFHWPGQKILKKETRKTRRCNVLESTNPNPSANGYSRVVSWVDEESDGIVHAEAYDSKNKLLKVFDIKSIEKKTGCGSPS